MKKGVFFICMISLFVVVFWGYKFVIGQHKYAGFKKKRYYAICSNNQGMVTNDIYLYKDLTFYTKVLGERYYGKYKVIGDTIHFVTDKLMQIGVCSQYLLIGSELVPINWSNVCSGNRMLFTTGLDDIIKE